MSYPTCFLHGKFHDMGYFDDGKKAYVSLWKDCKGLCVNTTEKCDGACEKYNQCESDSGSCFDTFGPTPNWQNCNGRCLPLEDRCDGKCRGGTCEHKGKCLDIYDPSNKGSQIFKNAMENV